MKTVSGELHLKFKFSRPPTVDTVDEEAPLMEDEEEDVGKDEEPNELHITVIQVRCVVVVLCVVAVVLCSAAPCICLLFYLSFALSFLSCFIFSRLLLPFCCSSLHSVVAC
jgi:hypothetical protein